MDTQFFLELETPLSGGGGSELTTREDSLGAAPGEGRNASTISTSPQRLQPAQQQQRNARKTDRSRTTPPSSTRQPLFGSSVDSPLSSGENSGTSSPFDKENYSRTCSTTLPSTTSVPWVVPSTSLPSRGIPRDASDTVHVPGTSLKPETYHQLKLKYLRSLNFNMGDHGPPIVGRRERGMSYPTPPPSTMPMAVPTKGSDLDSSKQVASTLDVPFVPPHELVNHGDSFSVYHYHQRKQGADKAM